MICRVVDKMMKNKVIKNIILGIYHFPNEIKLYFNGVTKLKCKENGNKVFYIGVPAHSNLGDLAQGMCIRRWLKKNYSDYKVIEFETNAIVNTHFSLLRKLKKFVSSNDIIVFQSGYTTTDLGGYADEMHKVIIKHFPENRILMMPQTIFFQSELRKKETSKIYNEHKKMLYLARDEVSFKEAKKMFPDVIVKCYPDIVTTLIGKYEFNGQRDGIMFCLRDDGEKFYSDEELAILEKRCSSFAIVKRTDTTKKKTVVKNAEDCISAEIEEYSKYKVIITDRYHGTILSLVAGTPVVILKTNDHKVVTGANWFKGVYDDYVYVANDLEDAYVIAKDLYSQQFQYKLNSYFKEKFYDSLANLFMESTK